MVTSFATQTLHNSYKKLLLAKCSLEHLVNIKHHIKMNVSILLFCLHLLCSRESEWALPVIAQVLRFIICIIIIMSPILVFLATLFKIIKNFAEGWESQNYIRFKVGNNQKRLICLSYPQTDKPNYLPWSWIFDSVQYQRAAFSKLQFREHSSDDVRFFGR